jgi:hypothetical protein
LLLDLDRRADGVDSRVEDGENTVAETLHDPAVLLADNGPDLRLEGACESVRALLTEPRAERSRLHDVDEHDRRRRRSRS